jgi:hypothetical protein
MKAYQELEEIIIWEYGFQIGVGEREEVAGYDLDIHQTTRNVWRALAKRNAFAELRQLPEEWQRFELLHLMTLDAMEDALELRAVN